MRVYYAGIGLVMARALEANGAKVYIVGRRKDTLDKAASTALHGNIIPLQGDVTSKSSLEDIAAHIATETGYVNLVIANSGIMGPNYNKLVSGEDGQQIPNIQEVQKILWGPPMEQLADVYNVNVIGVYYTAVAFLDLLDKGNRRGNVQQTSQVLVTSSIGAFYRAWPQAGMAYTTSKAAVTHLTKSLASYLIQYRIRVNAIAPGSTIPMPVSPSLTPLFLFCRGSNPFIANHLSDQLAFRSEMMVAMLGDADFTVEGSMPATMQPLKRTGRDEEIAGTVLYYASEAGAFCSGTIHVVDGGRLGIQPGETY
jgi:NAD(P)-dependent dehydrogenase (short-subunit alcohol dehydrogenase family)